MKPLTERDLDVLADLVYSRFESSMKHYYENGVAPIDFGGRNGSHHGKTASKLVDHGFVEHRRRGMAEWCQENRHFGRGGNRGSKVYRATEAGRDAIKAWARLRKGTEIASGPMVRKFGHMVPSTITIPMKPETVSELRLACHLEMKK